MAEYLKIATIPVEDNLQDLPGGVIQSRCSEGRWSTPDAAGGEAAKA